MNFELIAVIGMLVTNAAFLFGCWKYFDARLTRVYARMDEVRDGIESNYVRKDNCILLHNNTADNLRGLEVRMEKRFDKLDMQIEQLLNK
jgi:hypothetical protein